MNKVLEGIKKGLRKETPLAKKISVYVLGTIVAIAIIWFLQVFNIMIQFMGWFFIAVAILKFIDWKGFAKAFAMYDIVAKRSKTYSYSYPIIELALGLAFLFNFCCSDLIFVALIK